MANEQTFENGVAALVAADPRYRREAYELICEVISFAVRQLESPRHLSAAEVVAALLEYSRREYGPFAEDVLREWGVLAPADVGVLVYKLIGSGLLAASEEDSPDDFPRVTNWFAATSASAEPGVLQAPKID